MRLTSRLEKGIQIQDFLGPLGGTGMTGYFGLLGIYIKIYIRFSKHGLPGALTMRPDLPTSNISKTSANPRLAKPLSSRALPVALAASLSRSPRLWVC